MNSNGTFKSYPTDNSAGKIIIEFISIYENKG